MASRKKILVELISDEPSAMEDLVTGSELVRRLLIDEPGIPDEVRARAMDWLRSANRLLWPEASKCACGPTGSAAGFAGECGACGGRIIAGQEAK